MINYFFFESRQQSIKISFLANFYEVSGGNILDMVLKKISHLKNSLISRKYSEKLNRSGFLFIPKEKYLVQCR